ncbi:hypothetical protein NL676_015353 [Syzygium grande]|nr:hypothetical protein NL676_015353 [Syzygium grande]
MEAVEDIVIVGAGIAGLATALGLHRLGLRSLVLESSDGLRTAGYFSTTWTNAWMRPGSANPSAHGTTNSLEQWEGMELLEGQSTGRLLGQAAADDSEIQVREAERLLNHPVYLLIDVFCGHLYENGSPHEKELGRPWGLQKALVKFLSHASIYFVWKARTALLHDAASVEETLALIRFAVKHRFEGCVSMKRKVTQDFHKLSVFYLEYLSMNVQDLPLYEVPVILDPKKEEIPPTSVFVEGKLFLLLKRIHKKYIDFHAKANEAKQSQNTTKQSKIQKTRRINRARASGTPLPFETSVTGASKARDIRLRLDCAMEAVEDIVIVGAGIAGLATALGLHRLGIRSLVLESHDHLRTTGFALGIWTNGWKALDAVGVGESLRRQRNRLLRVMTSSTISGLCTAEIPLSAMGPQRDHEFRCVQRKILLETLEKELPSGTIKFSSKVVSIEESGCLKLIHLSDGSILKAKLLIGCDGVNSAVAKWLGFKKPAFPKIFLFMGEGVRYGVIPCDNKTIYWFFSFSPSNQDEEITDNLSKMKQFVLSKLGKVADNIKAVIDDTELDDMMLSPLRFRHPWEILWGSISKSNVCVAGDAFHPMTPDIAQGGCAALEDGVILARCMGEALRERRVIKSEGKGMEEEDEYKRMEMGLRNYAKERRWRAFQLITTAYTVGYMAQSNGKILNFLSKSTSQVLGRAAAENSVLQLREAENFLNSELGPICCYLPLQVTWRVFSQFLVSLLPM